MFKSTHPMKNNSFLKSSTNRFFGKTDNGKAKIISSDE